MTSSDSGGTLEQCQETLRNFANTKADVQASYEPDLDDQGTSEKHWVVTSV